MSDFRKPPKTDRKASRAWRGKVRRWALLPLALLSVWPVLAQSASDDVAELTDVPFEQLLATEVITAEKLARQVSHAPSVVSIVTAKDIRDFGYRSLGDILDSMRGLSMGYTSYQGFLSGRGYANAGSQSGRLTLLIDGHRATDGFFSSTSFGTDGLLDVDLIDRVEYIPGNGSSGEGDNAFLGVVNVITKKGRDFGGAQVATGLGSHGWRESRVTFGRQFDSGLDVLLSASGMASNGRHPQGTEVYPDIDRVEQHSNRRVFLKTQYQGWTLQAAQVNRKAGLPIDLNYKEPQSQSFIRLKYDGDLSEHLKASLDLYHGQFQVDEYFPSESLVSVFGARWRGVDAKLVGTWFDRHTLAWGAEYRDDYDQYAHQLDHGVEDPEYTYLLNRRTKSLYAYDDFTVSDTLQLNFGGRWDARNNGSQTFSPRVAAVYTPWDGTRLKLSTGKANRQQTVFSEITAPDPLVETLRTQELALEQRLGSKTRLTASLYRYRIGNFLFRRDLGWQEPGNHGPKASRGVELELEHLWGNGARLLTSYAYQNTYFPEGSPYGRYPANMAHNNLKFNFSVPLRGESLRLGLSARYLGSRLQNDWLTREPAYLVGDLTLSGKANRWTYSFSIRNLGNVRYNHVSGSLVNPQELYPADGRNFWFQLGYEFK